jgi:hypothetical protein
MHGWTKKGASTIGSGWVEGATPSVASFRQILFFRRGLLPTMSDDGTD